jgi:hypothetical protein
MGKWFIRAGMMVLSTVMVIGCASKDGGGSNVPKAATGEKLIWSSEPNRPKWVMNPPELEGAYWHFEAQSRYYADEGASREDAMRNTTTEVVKYLGTMAKDKFERIAVASGLQSDVVNPTEISNQFTKQFAAGHISGLKAIAWYTEKWDLPTGIGWKTYVLARVPKSSLDGSLASTIDQQLLDVKKKQKATNDETAKQQLDKYAENLKKMKEAGVVPEGE